MANTRDIRNRIKSVKNTSQITKAMQLVAASKMKRAQDTALEGRPYTALLAQMLFCIQSQLTEIQHPFLEQRPIQRRGILIITTDKGLCGGLNTNLFRLTFPAKDEARFVAIGRKGAQFLARSRFDLAANFSISDKAHFTEVRPVIDFMIDAFEKGEIDTIEVLYPRFINTLSQEPTLISLLPLKSLEAVLEEIAHAAGINPPSQDDREVQFEQEPVVLLDSLLRLYLKQLLYQKVLESKASEHSARMVAMKTATDNAETLIDDLTLEYNKVRQAAITQEILEISAASFAA